MAPRENENINEVWLSDRDRFSVEALYHPDRVTQPLMKKNNRWVEVEWPYALEAIAHLTSHIQKTKGADQIAGIAGFSETTEAYYLFQKYIRALGSPHVDYRIRTLDFSDQSAADVLPQFSKPISDIASSDAVLLVGSNIRNEQPILSTRIFTASQDDLVVMAVNPVEYPFVFSLAEKMIDENIIQSLAEIAKALADLKKEKITGLEKITPSPSAKKIAEKLATAQNPLIFVGNYALHHPHASVIRGLLKHIEKLYHATVGYLSDGANSAGAAMAGCVPHHGVGGISVKTKGKNAKTLLCDDPVSAYFLLNVELELDCVYPDKAMQSLDQAELVVCLSTFATEKMHQYADFILPVAPFSETDGSFVNMCGQWQSFSAASVPHKDAKPAWKILRALATLSHLSGFSYKNVHAVRDAIEKQIATEISQATIAAVNLPVF